MCQITLPSPSAPTLPILCRNIRRWGKTIFAFSSFDGASELVHYYCAILCLSLVISANVCLFLFWQIKYCLYMYFVSWHFRFVLFFFTWGICTIYIFCSFSNFVGDLNCAGLCLDNSSLLIVSRCLINVFEAFFFRF